MNKRFNFDITKQGNYDYVIGTDEAGRGPGAGPVFAAAVCFLNPDKDLIYELSLLNDSKKLNEKVRESLFEVIINNSVFAINQGSVEEIEKYNILNTSLLIMKKSCEEVINNLSSSNIKVLIDGNKKIPDFKFCQECIVKGDSQSAAIAAASILAKVSRDRFMKEIDKEFPQYHWSDNKGYITAAHLEAVDKYGLTKWHRKKFFEKHFSEIKQLSLL